MLSFQDPISNSDYHSCYLLYTNNKISTFCYLYNNFLYTSYVITHQKDIIIFLFCVCKMYINETPEEQNSIIYPIKLK